MAPSRARPQRKTPAAEDASTRPRAPDTGSNPLHANAVQAVATDPMNPTPPTASPTASLRRLLVEARMGSLLLTHAGRGSRSWKPSRALRMSSGKA